jgi:hypothetical protein
VQSTCAPRVLIERRCIPGKWRTASWLWITRTSDQFKPSAPFAGLPHWGPSLNTLAVRRVRLHEEANQRKRWDAKPVSTPGAAGRIERLSNGERCMDADVLSEIELTLQVELERQPSSNSMNCMPGPGRPDHRRLAWPCSRRTAPRLVVAEPRCARGVESAEASVGSLLQRCGRRSCLPSGIRPRSVRSPVGLCIRPALGSLVQDQLQARLAVCVLPELVSALARRSVS